MPRFRVLLHGGPVLLLDAETRKIDRVGFYTTRWVEDASAEKAGPLASRLARDDLAKTGTKAAPDEPLHIEVDEIAQVSWFEMARRGPGRGFTFYLDWAS